MCNTQQRLAPCLRHQPARNDNMEPLEVIRRTRNIQHPRILDHVHGPSREHSAFALPSPPCLNVGTRRAAAVSFFWGLQRYVILPFVNPTHYPDTVSHESTAVSVAIPILYRLFHRTVSSPLFRSQICLVILADYHGPSHRLQHIFRPLLPCRVFCSPFCMFSACLSMIDETNLISILVVNNKREL